MNMNNSNVVKTCRGFTLLELIIVIAVMAILVSWGFPSLRQSIQNNQMASQNNELISMLHYARSEAIRRNASIELHLDSADSGWQAYIVQPGVYGETPAECISPQLRCSSHTEVSLSTSATMITFNNRGYIREGDEAWVGETIYLEHNNCNNEQRRRIDVLATGQISSCSLACGTDSC